MCSIMFGKKEYLDLNIACTYNIYGPSCWYGNDAPGTTVRVDLDTPRSQTSSQESQKRSKIVVLCGPFLLQFLLSPPFPLK